MPATLAEWERSLADEIARLPSTEGAKRAALLPVVPDRATWDTFLVCVHDHWSEWKPALSLHPSCLVMLYCGLAFYEYDESSFWPQFARLVGSTVLPANQQSDINGAFADAVTHFGLKLILRGNGTDFVGSAVNFIGIPLSLWDGFLEVCDWALWRTDWRSLSELEWTDAITKRSGSRRRLQRFLTENRESASGLIQELLDAREILTADPHLTISDIAQACILRSEYFDEVPETADFLRPQNPDSLFQHRARLVWNEDRRNISLQLPSVSSQKLPGVWQIGSLPSQAAAQSPDEFILNSNAFSSSLLIVLRSGEEQETQRLRGVDDWGLFDLETGGQLTNINRDQLPLRSYILVSKREIEILSREGFEDDESQVNEQFELRDGAVCFVTRLWPTGKHAQLSLRTHNSSVRTVRFKTRAKIEALFIAGWGAKAAYFNRLADGKIKIDHLPIPCVTIPNGYFNDNSAELVKGFRIVIDAKTAAGSWEHVEVRDAPDTRLLPLEVERETLD